MAAGTGVGAAPNAAKPPPAGCDGAVVPKALKPPLAFVGAELNALKPLLAVGAGAGAGAWGEAAKAFTLLLV